MAYTAEKAAEFLRSCGSVKPRIPTGPCNRITDVPGVKVGHTTLRNGKTNTGVTVILPGEGNPFRNKYLAAGYVHNGFGKTAGLVQVQELGTLETPIALTNTLNVGLVMDALVEYTIRQCGADGTPVHSVNPVVGECNDSRINDICTRAVGEEAVFAAIDHADSVFEEGAVGAGTGTICYGLKGGIGSASRIVEIDGRYYTIGVLVQSNFGAMEDLVLNGIPEGQRIKEILEKSVPGEDRGSIISVLATDLPLSCRQLGRVIRRLGVGIARTGSYTGHGSGEIMVGFTTANRPGADAVQSAQFLREDLLNRAFAAAAEAEQEAILHSMLCAEPAAALNGEIIHSLCEFL